MAAFFVFTILTRAKAQPVSQGRLWEISGNGLQHSSYLFGTFHSTNPRVFAFPDSLLPILEQTELAGFELDMELVDPFQLAMAISSDTMLSDFFNPRIYSKMKASFAKKTGLRLEDFNGIKPVFTLSQLTQVPHPGDSTRPFDLYLQETARKRGIAIVGLETLEEQIGALASIPERIQANELRDALLKKNQSGPTLEALMECYLAGNLDTLYALAQLSVETDPEVNEALLMVRNGRMAEKIIELIQHRRCLFCVGALHLPGESGIIEILRRSGYKIRPVETP